MYRTDATYERLFKQPLKFSCTRCNVVMDADWNAAMNIAAAGAAVTRLEDASPESVKAAAL
jgi:transposase